MTKTETEAKKIRREALVSALHEYRCDEQSGVFSLEEGAMSGMEMKLPWARDPELAGSAL